MAQRRDEVGLASLSVRSGNKKYMILKKVFIQWWQGTTILGMLLLLMYIWGWMDFKGDKFDLVLHTLLVANAMFCVLGVNFMGANEE